MNKKKIKKTISKRKIGKRLKRKSSPELKQLMITLKKQQKPIWREVAKYLARPRRKAIAVNIDKINKISKADEIIIIPGKIISRGSLNHRIMIAAFSISKTAREKLAKNATIMDVKELIEKSPQLKNIKIRIIT